MMHLAFTLNTESTEHPWMAWLVNITTLSKAHHVELVFNDGTSLIAGLDGIVLKESTYDYYNWTLVPIPWIDYQTELKVREWAESIVAKKPKYDYIGAIFGRLNSDLENEDQWFCSELCMAALQPYTEELDSKNWYSPEDLWKLASEKIIAEYPHLSDIHKLRYRK